ncbi:hypothetical protein F935_02222 [Acinetobacter calcoaceticus ANC 3811]|uniref:Uncharacterized protein n=1 Tax=Acinetobacter calcoaceticus ANC 3811 TaxID=1217690 RepID=R8Y1P6_ACICA|nr:hypothetical protein [Acinetobacter calcoaceticus]EOQ63129.1 hypothetical protein F935_02222 [Acinetobacter calcoaceticus ANC 3811]
MSQNSINARITLYKITECGLYEKGGKSPVLGNLSVFLEDLEKWVHIKDKTLKETCTYASLDDEELNKTFCYDIKKDVNGNYLLITWNKNSSSNNAVATVSGSSKVGEATIQTNTHKPDDIPGFPTYFWIMPNKNRYATLTFDYAQNGRQAVEKYLREFFIKWSRFVVSVTDENGIEEIKCWEDPNNVGKKYPLLFSHFETNLVVNSGKIDFLLNHWKDIRKVYQHNEMSIVDIVKLPLLTRGVSKLLGMNASTSKKSGIKFKLEADVNFNNQSELKELINEWEKKKDPTKWEDIGFSLIGESQKVIWLSESRANNDFDCPLTKEQGGIFKTDELVEWLTGITSSILKLDEKLEE